MWNSATRPLQEENGPGLSLRRAGSSPAAMAWLQTQPGVTSSNSCGWQEGAPKSPKNIVSNRRVRLPGGAQTQKRAELPVSGLGTRSFSVPATARASSRSRQRRERRLSVLCATLTGSPPRAGRRWRQLRRSAHARPIPGSDAAAGARGAFPPLANGSAVTRAAGPAATPAPPPGPRPWTVRAPSAPGGWPYRGRGDRAGSLRATFWPLPLRMGAAQGAADLMVARGGAVEGSDSVPPLGGAALD